MKTLTILATMLYATVSFAFVGADAGKTFSGKGVWKDAEGKKGTYTSSVTFTRTSERGKALVLELTGTTKVYAGEEMIMEETGTTTWNFIGKHRFVLKKGDEKVGMGRCFRGICTYRYKSAEGKGWERMVFFPRKGKIRVIGGWNEAESRGMYRGILTKEGSCGCDCEQCECENCNCEDCQCENCDCDTCEEGECKPDSKKQAMQKPAQKQSK